MLAEAKTVRDAKKIRDQAQAAGYHAGDFAHAHVRPRRPEGILGPGARPQATPGAPAGIIAILPRGHHPATGGRADPHVRLKDGRRASEGLDIEEDEKQELLSAYAKLTEEVKTKEPKKGLLQMFWNAISGFAAQAAPLVELGKQRARAFGISAAP